MKRRLGWRRISREAFADHLRHAEIEVAEAIGDTSVYRCRSDDGNSIAIALPDGEGLIVEIAIELDPALDRRRRGAPTG